MTYELPLEEKLIFDVFCGETAEYQIPIYQRNYAWGKDEISTLIQDVYDAMHNGKSVYYIGTLVTYDRSDKVYEVIDGQQRLTTIYIVLRVLMEANVKNSLTFRAREKANRTLAHLESIKGFDPDFGIVRGFEYAKAAINEKVTPDEKLFSEYLLNKVHIIHYRVPKDVDLNHYFEVMNSRGEQLEKHEIVKAQLLSKFNENDVESRAVFSKIWEACSSMDDYIQRMYPEKEQIFDSSLSKMIVEKFDDIHCNQAESGKLSIEQILAGNGSANQKKDNVKENVFQPIIDFPNLLLVVLKITRMSEPDFNPSDFILDDKELINEFADNSLIIDEAFSKKFAFNLLKAKFLLDNFIVHHTIEEEGNQNPWKLEYWYCENKHEYPKNVGDGDYDINNELNQLLSMFEVSFTARQRKNYLFYTLLYLFKNGTDDLIGYRDFLRKLAKKYLYDVYLVPNNLNQANVPKPGSFDENMLKQNQLTIDVVNKYPDFNEVYGDGSEALPDGRTRDIPLFVFNYMDYRLWLKYAETLRGEKSKRDTAERMNFFSDLGCSDFDLTSFSNFYFSRTRRSLEHYFPQSLAGREPEFPTESNINCFGNFAMIGREANSSGSDWKPYDKIRHYLYNPQKIAPISVASLKFRIMLQKCYDNSRENGRIDVLSWNYNDIKEHQKKMLKILLSREEE